VDAGPHSGLGRRSPESLSCPLPQGPLFRLNNKGSEVTNSDGDCRQRQGYESLPNKYISHTHTYQAEATELHLCVADCRLVVRLAPKETFIARYEGGKAHPSAGPSPATFLFRKSHCRCERLVFRNMSRAKSQNCMFWQNFVFVK
jgi:hypothetical protein